MSKVKVAFVIIALVGIAGLSVLGATTGEISSWIPIGTGIAAAISAVISVFKKE